MSDRTYCTLEVKNAGAPGPDLTLAVATLVAAAFYDEEGYKGVELVGFAQTLLDEGEGQLNIEEMPCGYSDDLFNKIVAVIKETGVDFRFRLWEDPAYQWLGNMHYHIPGLVDVSSDCDSNGVIQVSGQSIVEMLDSPLYPSGIENWIRNVACVPYVQAWNA